VLVDPELTVREGHDIATAVRQSVEDADPRVVKPIIHVEPLETSPDAISDSPPDGPR
jgi:divalent metal cation (Fe/Co/Zn/Cd) transporter